MRRTTIVVQYWQGFEHLDRFARDHDLAHQEAWRRLTGQRDVQGASGEYEAVYGNMPTFGLPAATALCQSSAARLGVSDPHPPAVGPY